MAAGVRFRDKAVLGVLLFQHFVETQSQSGPVDLAGHSGLGLMSPV